MYTTQYRPADVYSRQLQPSTAPALPELPTDIRPLITRHRLRRQRRRKAATLLTGASIALGVAALRTPSAAARSDTALAPISHTHQQCGQQPPVIQHPAPD